MTTKPLVAVRPVLSVAMVMKLFVLGPALRSASAMTPAVLMLASPELANA